MDDAIQLIITGLVCFVCGVGATLILLWILSLGRKGKDKGASNQQEQLVRSISGTIADADSLVTQWRAGSIAAEKLVKELSAKIEIINRNCRLSIQSLDIYFVKFVESQIQEYNQLVEKVASAGGSSKSSQPVSGIVASSEIPIAESGVVASGTSRPPMEFDEPQEPSLFDNFTSESLAEAREDVVAEAPSGEEQVVVGPAPSEEAPVIVGEIEPTLVADTIKVAAEKPAVVEMHEERAIEETAPIRVEEKPVESISAPVDKINQPHLDELRPSRMVDDEQFALETLVDVDLSKLRAGEIKRTEKSKPIPAAETPQVSQPVSHTEEKPEEPAFNEHRELREEELLETIMIKREPPREPTVNKPTVRQVQPAKPVPAPVEDEEAVIPPTLFEIEPEQIEPAKEQPVETGDKKDANLISGDDVADKIDAFFGFK